MKIAPDGAGFFRALWLSFLPSASAAEAIPLLKTPQECGMSFSRRLQPAGAEKDKPAGASFMG